jgi:regulator of protease activity HflC (stomatin/prohibitin superfamily)
MLFAWIIVIVVVLAVLYLCLAVKVVKQYEQGVLFRLGRVVGVKAAGLTLIVPFIDILHRVSLRIVTMPIQSQGIITRDNVSVDVSAVAYYIANRPPSSGISGSSHRGDLLQGRGRPRCAAQSSARTAMMCVSTHSPCQ